MISRSSNPKKKHPQDFAHLGLTSNEDNCTKTMKLPETLTLPAYTVRTDFMFYLNKVYFL
jgi:hypothetical protein